MEQPRLRSRGERNRRLLMNFKTSCTTLPGLHKLIAVVGFPWRPSDKSQHAFCGVCWFPGSTSAALQILSFYYYSFYLPEKLVGPEGRDSLASALRGCGGNLACREERWPEGFNAWKGQRDTKRVLREDLVAVSGTNHQPHFKKI